MRTYSQSGIFLNVVVLILLSLLVISSVSASDTEVSVHVSGDQRYYGGEDIQISGTNTVTDKTYLFLSGPNLPSTGGSIKVTDPKNATNKVVNDDETNFQVVKVQSDNTWSWTWKTKNIAFEAGTYTIYAVSTPKDKTDLANTTYGTTSIMIFPENPLIWAKASSSSIKKGEKLIITGCAQGQPSNGVQIWIFGKNYTSKKNLEIDNEFFSYEISQEATKQLDAGAYYVVIQHPMGNGVFNIDQCLTNSNDICNIQTSGQTKIFTLLGPGSLVGADAAEALVAGIKEPNVDDTSLDLQFSVVEQTTTNTIVPTNVQTTNTVQTTVSSLTTTSVPITSQTTIMTTTPTAILTPSQTISITPSLTSIISPTPTKSVEKLLEEQNKKIDEQNNLIAEQNKKIAEQSDLISQLLNYLKGIFGWK
jgi:hypothetical protein